MTFIVQTLWYRRASRCTHSSHTPIIDWTYERGIANFTSCYIAFNQGYSYTDGQMVPGSSLNAAITYLSKLLLLSCLTSTLRPSLGPKLNNTHGSLSYEMEEYFLLHWQLASESKNSKLKEQPCTDWQAKARTPRGYRGSGRWMDGLILWLSVVVCGFSFPAGCQP